MIIPRCQCLLSSLAAAMFLAAAGFASPAHAPARAAEDKPAPVAPTPDTKADADTADASAPKPAPVSGENAFSEASQQFDFAGGLLRRNFYPEAAVEFGRFLERFPDDARAGEARLWRGEALFQGRRFLPAAHDFYAYARDAARHGPADRVDFARVRYGACLFELKQYASAVETLSPFLAPDSKTSEDIRRTAAYYSGLALFADNKAEAAADAFARVDRGPMAAHALFLRGEIAAGRDRPAEAAALFADYAKRHPDHPLAQDARLRQAEELRRAGRPDEAAPLLEALIAQAPAAPATATPTQTPPAAASANTPPAPEASAAPEAPGVDVDADARRYVRAGYALARLRLDLGDAPAARAAAEAVAAVARRVNRPELADEARYIAGHAALIEKDYAAAAEAFAAVAGGPLASEAARRRAWALLLAGRAAEARQAADDCEARFPEQSRAAEMAYLRGRLDAREKQWTAAAAQFLRARDLALRAAGGGAIDPEKNIPAPGGTVSPDKNAAVAADPNKTAEGATDTRDPAGPEAVVRAVHALLAADAAYEHAYALDQAEQFEPAAAAYARAAELFAALPPEAEAATDHKTDHKIDTVDTVGVPNAIKAPAASTPSVSLVPSSSSPTPAAARLSGRERPPRALQADAYAGQGRALVRAGRPDAALAAYARFLDLSAPLADNPDLQAARPWVEARLAAYAQQAACFHRLEQFDNMRAAYEALLEQDAAFRQRDVAPPADAAAPAAFSASAAPSPLAAEAWYWLGWHAANRKAFAEAAGFYARVADTFPKNPLAAAARHRQALCLFQAERPAESADAYLRLLREAPDADVEIRELLWLGQWLVDAGRDPDADAAYGALLARGPEAVESAYALYWQGEIKRRAGDWPAARERYAAALAAGVADVEPPARYGLAAALRELGSTAEARAELDRLSAGVDAADPLALAVKYQSGLLLLAENKTAEGMAALLQVGLLCEDENMAGDALLKAGEAALASGDRRKAAICFGELAGVSEDGYGRRHPESPYAKEGKLRYEALREGNPPDEANKR